MSGMVEVRRIGPTILPDTTRLVSRPFLPNGPNFGGEGTRLFGIVDRLLGLDQTQRRGLLAAERARAEGRFRDLEGTWLGHYELATALVPDLDALDDPEDRLLVGAFLSQAYAYEGVSLTNPSMVPVGDPGQETQEFVMSARAIGEGHISSIAFLTGRARSDGSVEVDVRQTGVSNGTRSQALYERSSFDKKLGELGIDSGMVDRVLDGLASSFTGEQLDQNLRSVGEADVDPTLLAEAKRTVHWLAASNYVTTFDDDTDLTERLLFPAAPLESRGMEDARFVRFTDDEGRVEYRATYTAFDGRRILPQLIRTSDFSTFRIATMSGPMAHNKGMALFPRLVGGDYVALSRHDNESLFVMRSDDVRHWSTAELLIAPEFAWEAIQIGNCGSPIETDEGWLVITHGVGPMRRYVLGALLLELDEPSKVIGRLPTPLLEPGEDEGHGLVPNVVYSCGAMVHKEHLVVPYGFADYGIRFAAVSVQELLSEMA